jgi:hypothetical protein
MRYFTVAMLAAMALGGCAGLPETVPLDEERPESIDAAFEAWTEMFGPPAERCQRERPRLGWRMQTMEEIGEICDSGPLYGCMKQDSLSIFISIEHWGTPTFEQILQHELSHWLIRCDGWQGKGDPAHAIDAVWGPEPGTSGGSVHLAWELAGAL